MEIPGRLVLYSISPCPTCPTFLVSPWPLYFPTLPIHSTYNKGWPYLLTLLLLPPPCNHLLLPLLPNPPHTQHLQQGVALLAHPPPSASPLQPPPPPSPGHHAVNGNALACQRYL